MIKEPIQQAVIPYHHAKKYFDRVYTLLQPNCDRIDLAGSVSRMKDYVKDIEIVCTPKKVFHQTDLFGSGVNTVCPEFINVINTVSETVVKGLPTGRYMQIILKGSVKLDLFMPAIDDYYRQLAIRTGSVEFSKMFLAARWVALGWVGTKYGLRRKRDCYPKKNEKGEVIYWVLSNPNGEKPPIWTSEKDFFEWIGIRWVEPRLRG